MATHALFSFILPPPEVFLGKVRQLGATPFPLPKPGPCRFTRKGKLQDYPEAWFSLRRGLILRPEGFGHGFLLDGSSLAFCCLPEGRAGDLMTHDNRPQAQTSAGQMMQV
jgi:hypothetical protein